MSCKECGGQTELDFPLCRHCWTRHRTGTHTTASVRPSVANERTPLDVVCDYVYPSYVDEKNTCGALEGEPCRFSQYVPFLDMRVVVNSEWRVEVHEARFRKWRSPVIA